MGQACLKVAEAFGCCTDLSGPGASVGEGNLGTRCNAWCGCVWHEAECGRLPEPRRLWGRRPDW